MGKLSLMLVIVFAISLAGYSQPQWKTLTQVNQKKDTTHRFIGTLEGHVRSFYMATINQDNFPDYHAWALGAGLGYYSPQVKRFQVGMSGFSVHNLSSSITSQAPYSNRYEIGLFDLEHPDSQKDFARVEDFFLRYYLSKKNSSFFQLGKFHLKTPLINLQDGRMLPNLQQGFWSEWNNWKKVKVKAGWITRTSPRSTSRWMDISESLIYTNGKAVNGVKADYSRNIQTRGVAIFGVTTKPSERLEFQTWNYTVDRLFNMAHQKLEWNRTLGKKKLVIGAQYFWQKSLFRDSTAVEKQYISTTHQSHTFSARAAITISKHQQEWSLNYTRITRHGRFLFPREWGIEPFYTFMQRERNEGAGDVHAATVQYTRSLDQRNTLTLVIANGFYHMPSVLNAPLNKYSMPSYYQLNAKLRYQFSGKLRGLNAEFLYTFKQNLSTGLEELPVYYHNKVNLHHASLAIDYYF